MHGPGMDPALSYKGHFWNRWKSTDGVLNKMKMYCHREMEIESSYKRACTVRSHFSKNTHTCIKKYHIQRC